MVYTVLTPTDDVTHQFVGGICATFLEKANSRNWAMMSKKSNLQSCEYENHHKHMP